LGALTSCGFGAATSTDAREVTGDPSVTMRVMGSTATQEGVWKIRVEVSNPRPDPVKVTSSQVKGGTSSWQEATVVVPAGSTEQMIIHGQGPQECAADQTRFDSITGTSPPWEFGAVRADGEVIMPVDDAWC
jgi:hypothetical protein